ncbi:MAG TPA: hypothetical protein VMT85_15820 [Thermoanaerobaculia bacterium]|nr:hypothetical protein [Thermoanaerobaculia bacterium]
MNAPQLAAVAYTAATVGACIFQVALASGAPWGELAMGGRFPGRFPPPMRVAALAQALVLVALAAVVLSKAGVAFPQLRGFAVVAIWAVVVISVVSLVLNSMTPSRRERILWAPVALVMTVSSLVVALVS